jgi:hypothetical protein
MYQLRLLSPREDIDLYREAYLWRERPKKHVQPDRMSFEGFSSEDPRHIAIGLFNGQLLAVYFLHETEPGNFQAHFTSQRNVPYFPLLEGARKVTKAILENGGSEIHAWITPRNRVLKKFLETLQFAPVETKSFPKNKDSESVTVQPFVKYVLMGNNTGPFRQKADEHSE